MDDKQQSDPRTRRCRFDREAAVPAAPSMGSLRDAAPVTPLERLRELRRETAELHVVINEAQGHRMHAEARQQIIAWALRVEPVLQSQDEEHWKMLRSVLDPPPELLDRSIPQPVEMTDEQWERHWDMQDSNILRSFLRRKAEALGRAISRLLA
jgi:hypothetical protein